MWLYISFVEEIHEDCTSLCWLLLQGSQSQQNERNPSIAGQEQCGQCSSVGGNKDTMWRMIGAGVLTRTRSFDIIVIFILETMQKCWFILIYCVHCVYVVLSKLQHLLYELALDIHVIFFSVCNLVPILPIFVQFTDQQLIKIWGSGEVLINVGDISASRSFPQAAIEGSRDKDRCRSGYCIFFILIVLPFMILSHASMLAP